MARPAQVQDMAETERKSKRKAPPREDDSEPTGLRKAIANPIVILGIIIVVVILLVLGIWGLAGWLSGG